MLDVREDLAFKRCKIIYILIAYADLDWITDLGHKRGRVVLFAGDLAAQPVGFFQQALPNAMA